MISGSFSTDDVRRTWERYEYMRDEGHNDFVVKADQCDAYVAGHQWDQSDLAKLRKSRRPALTINEILRVLSNILGEQIRTRSDIAFRPARRGSQDTSYALQRTYQQISESNQLDWIRSEVYADGLITSRAYYDVRLDFSDNMLGEVRVTKPNPKGVLLDPDADSYDPDAWEDVISTSWWSLAQIEAVYGKHMAKELELQAHGAFMEYGDSVVLHRDGFGRAGGRFYQPSVVARTGNDAGKRQVRQIRVLDRQYRDTVMVEYLVDPVRGDLRVIPESWDRNRIATEIETYGYSVIKRPGKVIHWSVVGCGEELFKARSPYRHMTIVPYFPHFRNGATIGLVETLLSPQDLLNKTTSQELHVINTTANSGYKVKTGNLVNMTAEELEARGAESGIVIELQDIAQLDKIQPNTIPTGLDRLSTRAEEFLKVVANVSDSMLGFDREDVAAKAIAAKQARGAVNLIKPIDNLERSDWLLARTILSIVQDYYTEPRIVRFTVDEDTGATEEITVNERLSDGSILYDLTLGEYDIIVTSQPDKATIEDSQFEQAKTMKELGIAIPDRILLENSRLLRRNELIKQMENAEPPPDKQAELAKLQAEIDKIRAEIDRITADAASMRTRAAGEAVRAINESAQAPVPEKPSDNDDKALLELTKQAMGTPKGAKPNGTERPA